MSKPVPSMAKPIPTPISSTDPAYHCVKFDNTGISASDKVDGSYDPVITISQSAVTIPERLSLFLGRLSISDFIIHMLRDQLQVQKIITNIITTFLSKWIDFNDDGTITIKGSTAMTGDVKLTNGLNVTGETSFNNNVNFEDTTVFNGQAGFVSGFKSNGAVDFQAGVEFLDVVNFDGDVSMQKDIEVSGKVALNDDVKVKGDLVTKGSLTVKGGIIETDHDDDAGVAPA